MKKVEGGFKLARVHLETTGRVDGLDEAAFQAMAEKAKDGCPVSQLLKPGLEEMMLKATCSLEIDDGVVLRQRRDAGDEEEFIAKAFGGDGFQLRGFGKRGKTLTVGEVWGSVVAAKDDGAQGEVNFVNEAGLEKRGGDFAAAFA